MKKILALLALSALFLTACQVPFMPGDSDQGTNADTDTENYEVADYSGITDTDTDEISDADESADEEEDLKDRSNPNLVDFHDTPVQWSSEVVMSGYEDYYQEVMPGWADDLDDFMEEIAEQMAYYETGIFLNGDYEGQALVFAKPYYNGPAFSPMYHHFAVDESADEWTLLGGYSYSDQQEEWMVLVPFAAVDNTIYIEELESPEELDLFENDSVYLSSEFATTEADLIEDGAEELRLSDDSFEKYYLLNRCYYGVYPDGLASRYSIMPTEFYELNEQGNIDYQEELTLETVAGETVDKEFMLYSGSGCGFVSSCLAQYSPTESEVAGLEKLGELDGRDVWLPTDLGDEPAEDAEESFQTKIYEAYQNYTARLAYKVESEGLELMTTQEFIDDSNMFFMEMDNGGYTIIYNQEYGPMAECGKPVIYLYPETDTVVNVQVGIDEFTITDPLYGEDGWTVLATPDSQLTNLEDGQTYPYLFWEGHSDKAFPLGPGWTLAKDEIAKTLPVVLHDLGLNDQETADFMEFWEPHLMDEKGKYVEFNFVAQQLFDQVAPLTVIPAPDQVIRVYMVYSGTNTAGAEVPNYHAPKRYGFTLVEWGGELH
jgi:hypothetical protein